MCNIYIQNPVCQTLTGSSRPSKNGWGRVLIADSLRCIVYAFDWVIMTVALQAVLVLKHAEDIHQIEV